MRWRIPLFRYGWNISNLKVSEDTSNLGMHVVQICRSQRSAATAVVCPRHDAGFFFTMTGAIFSHVAIGDDAISFFGPALLLILTIASWYFRPDHRRFFIPFDILKASK